MTASTIKPQLRHALLRNLNAKQSGKKNLLQKGFTLVELMIVIVIVGILSAVALPNFLSQTEKAKATEAKTKISAYIKQGHAEWQEAGSVTDASGQAEEDTEGKFNYTATAPAGGAGDQIFEIKAAANGTDPSLGTKVAYGCVNLNTGKTDISSSLSESATSDVDCTSTP